MINPARSDNIIYIMAHFVVMNHQDILDTFAGK